MIKKYSEYLLILTIALVFTLSLHYFLKQSELADSDKAKIQVSLENTSNRWNDLFYRSLPEKSPSADVVVLAIDEASIIEVGRWPWSRSTIDKITQQLLKNNIKTLAYDIIFSESENAQVDGNLADTVSKARHKIIFGTFSDNKTFVKPYQDFCLTQAFLNSGGDNLVKVNPLFAVLDEENAYEEYEFNKLFTPIFEQINLKTEADFLQSNEIEQVKNLSSYQLNTLEHSKKRSVYSYCARWLTAEDEFTYDQYPALKDIYLKLFKVESEAELQTALSAFKLNNDQNPIPQYTMWRHNIDQIQNQALYTANFVAYPDMDGIIRRYPLALRTGNQLGTSYIPSIALQTYLANTGYQAQIKIENNSGRKKVSGVEIINTENDQVIQKIPVDYQGKMLINYYGKQNTIMYVSAKDLLNDSPKINYFIRTDTAGEQIVSRKYSARKDNFFKNKNVIFGATAIGIYDIRTTPNDINYPGPEIHATVLSNLLNKDFLLYDAREHYKIPLIFLLFITLNLLIFIKTDVRIGLTFFTLMLISLVTLQIHEFNSGRVYLGSFLFLAYYILTYFLTFIYKYFFQSRRSNEIKNAFSKYVSKDLVEEILKNENAIELRGQKLHMSVFFSDIRGFTEFSEKMDPVELSVLLNKYFTPMSNIITEHQGTIDKYIGDAIMAMFGAPVNYSYHAVQACTAALKCIEALDKINEEFQMRKWPKIQIGIGINSGYMNVGNVGSDTIQNYTVIGDSVNLASRLQSLNKEYGTQIIISEFTYESVKNAFICREIDKVHVRGRTEPVKIYELQKFV